MATGKDDHRPRAYLVVGPERSGTRMLTGLLVMLGCLGNDGHAQPFDEEIPPASGQPIVWRRSYPHGGKEGDAHGIIRHWPPLLTLSDKVIAAGYDPVVLIMVRDWYAVARSQMANELAPDYPSAIDQIRHAYLRLFHSLIVVSTERGYHLPYCMVSYESVTADWSALKSLLADLNLLVPGVMCISDGNGLQILCPTFEGSIEMTSMNLLNANYQYEEKDNDEEDN